MSTAAPNAAAPPASTQHLNSKQIAMLKGLRNGTLLPQLLKTYRDDTRRQIGVISEAVASGDQARVATSAHALKSASFSVGADAIGTLCATIEGAARRGELTDGAIRAAELHALYVELLPELEQYIPS